MTTTVLNNGKTLPLLGFGVFQVTDYDECVRSVLCALEAGCRLIDTAACYGNEQAVGEAVAKSGITRTEITLVSKVWIQDAGYEKTLRSFEKTLRNLRTEYLDLYLIHMPYGDYYGSWRAMEKLYRKGQAGSIGVCNFSHDRLLDLILGTQVIPAVNQIELHPFCQQKELRQLMNEYDIKAMAWAPFAQGQNGIFEDKILSEIAHRYGKTNAQVVLAFLNQSGCIAIPKSVHENRIRENAMSSDLTLSAADMSRIEKMDKGKSLILDVQSIDEVRRLHNIHFEQ